MKKLLIALVSIAFVIGMASCSSEANAPATQGDNADPATTTAATTDGTATPNATATPPAPKKPGWQEKAEAMAKTNAAFETEEHDFGKVTDGDIVRHTFTFTNNGDNPLVIQRAKASCGCTVPQWTKEPVAPGEKGEINVEFNSKGKVGMQTKTITVTANFDGGINKVLRIKGEVAPAAN